MKVLMVLERLGILNPARSVVLDVGAGVGRQVLVVGYHINR